MDKIRLLVNARARGFTLLELVIAIAIVAILGVVLVPTFRGEREKLETKEFVAKLNTLMQAAWQQALSSQKVQRVFFDFNKKSIALSEQSDKDEKNFVLVRGPYITTEIAIPANYYFRNFYIQGTDEMGRGGKRKDSWFFLMPSGVAQDVIINIMNQDEDMSEGDAQKFGLVLNPFSAQFGYYDSYQKP